MWAMLRTGFSYNEYSHADGVYVHASLPVDLATMLQPWPGLTLTENEEYSRFGAYGVSIAARGKWTDSPPPPLDGYGKASWSAVQMFVLQQLGMDGWEPYAYGPGTSAAWPIHLLRKRIGAGHAASLAG